jgi:hypothetical protein
MLPEIDHQVSQILQGKECVVSFAGLSQYSWVSESGRENGSGSSACGLVSFNCARIVLTKERDGVQGTDLLKYLLKRGTFEVTKIRKTER